MKPSKNSTGCASSENGAPTDPGAIEHQLRESESRNQVEAYEVADGADQRVRAVAGFLERVDIAPLPKSVPDLWQSVVRHLNSACLSQAIAGMSLLLLKEMVPKGQFTTELEDRGIPERTAREAMQIAKALARMPSRLRDAAQRISGQKILALAKLDDDTLQLLDEEGSIAGRPLDQLELMSRKELRVWIDKERARQQAREADLKKEGDRQRDEIADLKQQLSDATAQQHPSDEAEAASLRALQQIEDSVRMSLARLDANSLVRATPSVKLMAARIVDFVGSYSHLISVSLRREFPECWEGWEPPSDDEISEATRDHLEKAGRLRGKPISDLQ